MTAILANGDFPAGAIPLGWLRRADSIVCCDGAARACLRRLHRLPDAVVGDGDSLDAATRRRLGPRFHPVAEQDTNDLAKAFRFALAHGARAIVILGAAGRREDHALGNIFRLLDFARQAPRVMMVTDTGAFHVVCGGRSFAARRGQAVSVFAPRPGTRVRSRGLEWRLDGVDLSDLWAGTLNRVSAARSFTVSASKPVLVFIAAAGGERPR